MLEALEQSGEMNTWIKEEREKAKIEILDPALRGYRFKQDEKWEEAARAYEKALRIRGTAGMWRYASPRPRPTSRSGITTAPWRSWPRPRKGSRENRIGHWPKPRVLHAGVQWMRLESSLGRRHR